jgi:riboflavin synthase
VFTGIVRELGRVVSVDGGPGGIRLEVEAPRTAAGSGIGDSVALNGVCLTAVAIDGGRLAFDAVPETLSRTSLERLTRGPRLNDHPARRAGDPLGGHYMQGHVDGLGSVRTVAPEGEGRRVWFDASPELLRYTVEKGSIAVEGTSLTVADLDESGFAVVLVPHTLAETTLGELAPGDPVNLEVDVLAKYVERLLLPGARG